MIQQQLTRSAADAEAKLMLASVVTVQSNGFVFHHCITEEPGRKITLTVLSHNNILRGPFLNCQEQQQQCCRGQRSSTLFVDCVE
jgi:hypothetical protein